jgi:hypothetical protein
MRAETDLIPLLLEAADLLRHVMAIILLLGPPVGLVVQALAQLGAVLLGLAAQLLLPGLEKTRVFFFFKPAELVFLVFLGFLVFFRFFLYFSFKEKSLYYFHKK